MSSRALQWLLAILLILLAGALWQAEPKWLPTKTAHGTAWAWSAPANDRLDEGAFLSQIYCSSCHVYPEPGLLTKQVWKVETMPVMGVKMGIYFHDNMLYPTEPEGQVPDDYYSEQAMLSRDQWQKILDYYQHAAPETLEREGSWPTIKSDTLFFRAHFAAEATPGIPEATAVRFNAEHGLVFAATARRNQLQVFDRELSLQEVFEFSSPISDIRITPDAFPGSTGLLLTFMGSLMPTDRATGMVYKGGYRRASTELYGQTLKTELLRPVQSLQDDVSGNGLPDILVSEFGHRRGSLFWLENEGGFADMQRHVLTDIPGCIDAKVLDYTGNGLPDVLALCTQETQALLLFANEGNGEFREKRLIQFGITYGSMAFSLHDFNNNGLLDVLYVNGDNADYSSILKPYHGVRIYLNQGNDRFEEAWFHPIHGAYQAEVRDFDKNGLLDIALISFFGNYDEQPEEGFVFFKNETGSDGRLRFAPYHHPAASLGRWVKMDVADWTGNGYDDIVLGNFAVGPTKVSDELEQQWIETGLIMVLENRFGEAETRLPAQMAE